MKIAGRTIWIAPVLFIFLTIIIRADGALNDDIYENVRIIEDLNRLDVIDCFANPNRYSALARFESQGMQAMVGYKFDPKTGTLTPEPKSDHPEVDQICSGIFKDIFGLNGSVPYDAISSTIAYKMAMIRSGEEARQFSPFRTAGNYIVLIRFPGKVPNQHLSDYPDLYLLTPDVSSSLRQLKSEDIAQYKEAATAVISLNEPEILSFIVSTGKKAPLDIIWRLKSILQYHSISNDEIINNLLTLDNGLTANVVTMLLSQKDKMASDKALAAILKELSDSNQQQSYKEILLGLMAAETSGGLSIQSINSLKVFLKNNFGTKTVDPMTKEMVRILSE